MFHEKFTYYKKVYIEREEIENSNTNVFSTTHDFVSLSNYTKGGALRTTLISDSAIDGVVEEQ